MSKISVERTLLRAETHLRRGELDTARALYQAVLAAYPRNQRAQQGLARLGPGGRNPAATASFPADRAEALIALFNQGRLGEVVQGARALLADNPSSSFLWNILAAAQAASGQFREAETGFRKAIEINPDYADGHVNLASALREQGKLDEAVATYRRAIEIRPENAVAHYNLGNALKDQGDLDAALSAYRKALAIRPAHAEAHTGIGTILKRQGKLQDAIAAYESALRIKPDHADAHNNLGNALKETGRTDRAIAAYRRALAARPGFAEAHNNLGVTLQEQGRLSEAIEAYRSAVAVAPSYIDALSNMGNALMARGDVAAAVAAFREVIARGPARADARIDLGNALRELGRPEEALAAYRAALDLDPDFAEASCNAAVALQELGRHAEAIAACDRALAIRPDLPQAHVANGIACKALGRPDDALAAFARALALDPHCAEAHNNIGVVLQAQGDPEAALAAYSRALEARPEYAEASNNMGTALQELGRSDAAIAAYDRAIAQRSDYADAHYGRGVALHATGRPAEALAAYGRALAIRPDHADALNNSGNALKDLGRLDDAIAAYRQAVAVRPDHAAAHYNLAVALQETGEPAAALAAFRSALDARPDYAAAEALMIHLARHLCDWSDHDRIASAVARLGVETEAVSPFAMLALADDPGQHLLRARRFAADSYRAAAQPTPAPAPADRIRVGYFSADFHNHATLHLMAGLLRSHDRSRFEIACFSYGQQKSDVWRDQLQRDVEHFHDVSQAADREIVALAHGQGLDIALDLKGYTQHTRSDLFQHRLAPLQINYLGYPGTMGAGFIDYIVADPVVIPPQERGFYSEQVIYLPHSYQPNDNSREIAPAAGTRADFGLPESGVVLCCFNNPYKIGPDEFDIWMRILSHIDGSVLWLLRANPVAEENLRREAQRRGIDPARLVFADRLAHAEHLARHRHADLFVDTFAYTAHTTASDALWSGLPVVTKAGRQFAARVGASLLAAAGLPELIASDEAGYEALILALAGDLPRLAALRTRLVAGRRTVPLFDTEGYTRDFETGLEMAHRYRLAGLAPQDIRVPPR